MKNLKTYQIKKFPLVLLAFAALMLLGGNANAQEEGEDASKQMRAQINLALAKVFQKLEREKIADTDPNERDAKRRGSVGQYTSNKDYRQAMVWADQLEVAGQLAFTTPPTRPSVREIVAHMAKYEWKESRCSMPYVLQILHAYNQELDIYFERDDSKLQKIARLIDKIENSFTNITGSSKGHRVFSNHETQQEREWKALINGALKHYQVYCKKE